MKQPNLGYADVKLNFACMHPAGCALCMGQKDNSISSVSPWGGGVPLKIAQKVAF